MTIAYVAGAINTTGANNTTSLTVNKPTGTLDGHVMIMSIGAQTNTTAADVTINAPAGWTLIDQLQDDDGTTRVKLARYWKLASGEGSNYALSISSTAALGRFSAAILSYSGVDPTTPIAVGERAIAKQTTTTANRVTPSITTAGNRWLVGTFVDSLGPMTLTDLTERLEYGGSSNLGHTVGDSNGIVAAGTYTRNATSNSTGVAVTGLLALQPAPSVPVAAGSVGTERYVPLDFSASAPVSGGTITHSLDVSTGFIANGTGKWLAPQGTTAYTVTDTITESPSGQASTVTVTVPALASGTASGKERIRVFTGTGSVA